MTEKREMSAHEAAYVIRDEFAKKPPVLAPEDQYTLAYLEAVYKHLVELAGKAYTKADGFVLEHIKTLLAEAGVEIPKAAEYPKALNKTDDRGRTVSEVWPDNDPEGRGGQPVVFHTKEDEAKYSKPKPAPAVPPKPPVSPTV